MRIVGGRRSKSRLQLLRGYAEAGFKQLLHFVAAGHVLEGDLDGLALGFCAGIFITRSKTSSSICIVIFITKLKYGL